MEKAQVDDLRDLFQPLINDLGDVLKSILLTGSAVRKERVEGSDIDLIILLDDHSDKFSRKHLKLTEVIVQEIEEEAEEDGYGLHIQPPRTISSWYELLLDGQPWAVTSMRYSQAVYDPDSFQKTMSSVIASTPPSSEKSRAKKLLAQAQGDIKDADNKLREETLGKMAEAIYQLLSAVLRLRGIKHVEKDKAAQKFREEINENSLEKELELYERLRRIQTEIDSGEREFELSEISSLQTEAEEALENLEDYFWSEKEKEHEKVVEQVFEEIKESCRKVLEDYEIDFNEDNTLEVFEQEIIDEGIISREYWDFIQSVKQKKRNSEEVQKDGVYRPMVQLKDFETAVENVTSNDFYRTFSLENEDLKAQLTIVNEFEKKVLEEFEERIKAVWVLTFENFLETSDANVVLLWDDINYEINEEVRERCNEIEWGIGEEHSFNIHTRIEPITDFWHNLQDGEAETISEVRTAIISYDPNGLIESTDKLVESGAISGNKTDIIDIAEDSEKLLEPGPKSREEALTNYYRASIKLGQAALLNQNISPPVQKKVPETLEKSLSGLKLSSDDVNLIEEVIRLYKEVEYGNVEKIDLEKLEEISSRIKNVERATAETVQEK